MKAAQPACPRPRRTQARVNAGFSLLEVLVSMVVLSFGLLGLVGLQAASLQANRDARLQSAAAQYAREFAELAASNAMETRGKTTAADNPFLLSFSGTQAASAIDCLNTTCSSLDFARSQVAGWQARISAATGPEALPGVRVVSCFDKQPYETSTGLPVWNCTSGGGQMVVKIGWTRGATQGGTPELATSTAARPQIVVPVSQ